MREPTLAAWLLDLGEGQLAALSIHLLREVISSHELHRYPPHPLPLALAECRHLMFWRERPIPLLQLNQRLSPDATPPAFDQGTRIVVALPPTNAAEAVRYCALQLAQVPQRITVDPNKQCALPDPNWASIATACFHHQQQAIPVLNPDGFIPLG